MKEYEKIPTSKIERATKFLTTGAKVGGNFVKHYTKKAFDPSLSRDELDKKNAEDIFNSLSELKGGALKVMQMISMDKNTLPTEYAKKFAEAQYKAPALSYPLVVKTFQQYFGKGPTEIFESFSKNAIHAASIGQVHEATLNGKKLAVKVQYPGVADSLTADLKIVKPLASTLFNIRQQDVEHYMEEVTGRLIEETDYENELRQGSEIAEKCKDIENVRFPTYYPTLSNKKVLTMDWLDGMHLDKFIKENHPQETKNKVGQALWDFYNFQIHQLRQVHADPHPGNFLIQLKGNDVQLGILDFGCVKRLPDDFYNDFVKMLDKSILDDESRLEEVFLKLSFINENDTAEEKAFFFNLSKTILTMLTKPVYDGKFNFGDKAYFKRITDYGQEVARMKEVRNTKYARGPRDGIYLGRVYFGLYNILQELEATIDTRTWQN
ncbi:MAG: AarF/ABC1/UbiB kinase family protein [Chitinophagales bacterium]|nr:AarF/ABC1/UbiB kinase family protein [Chitinophagales bacterium]